MLPPYGLSKIGLSFHFSRYWYRDNYLHIIQASASFLMGRRSIQRVVQAAIYLG